MAQWKDLPQNSVAQLHKVKDIIDDQLTKSQPNATTGAIDKVIPLAKQKELIEAKQTIQNVLKQSDNYNTAMESTYLIKRNEYYNQMLDKVKGETGGGNLTLEKMSSAVMPNVLRTRQFYKDALKAGADPEQTKQLIQVTQSLKGSPLWDVLKTTGKAKADARAAGRDFNIVQQIVSDLTLNRYYKAMTEIMLSGDKWKPQIAEALRATDPLDKQIGLLKLVGKVATLGTVSAVGEKAGTTVNNIVRGQNGK